MTQVVSKERVQKFGEVYTNSREINGMLDLLSEITIDMTFLEPTCGNGNFIIEILKRKFNLCKKKADYIKALESVYGIDILQDNIDTTRKRVLELYHQEYNQKENVDFIINTHFFQGDALAIMQLLEKASVDK